MVDLDGLGETRRIARFRDGFDQLVACQQERSHVPGHEERVSDSAKEAKWRREIKHVGHDRADIAGGKMVVVIEPRKGALHHRVSKVMGAIELADANRQSLPYPEMSCLPGDRLAKFN